MAFPINRQGSHSAMKTAGLFITHVSSLRIDAHYRRLAEETAHLIEWHLALNPDDWLRPQLPFSYPAAERVVPQRFRQVLLNRTVHLGSLDAAIIPCILGADADFTWVIEYDVDFAGSWAALFEQFMDNHADLLGTTLHPKHACPDWSYWRDAIAPPSVPASAIHRGFFPIMRLSRRLVHHYCDAMQNPGWMGHYEFTIPTVALSAGMMVEDIGGDGPFTPAIRRGLNYDNNYLDDCLAPGTFIWRPSRSHYFHEDPDGFVPCKLYHPVKPGVEDWTLKAVKPSEKDT